MTAAQPQVFLRAIVKEHVKGEVRMADVEADVKRVKHVDVTGKLLQFQEPMNESLRIYRSARDELKAPLWRGSKLVAWLVAVDWPNSSIDVCVAATVRL